MSTAFSSQDDLERFRRVQRLAYDCVQHVEKQLTASMTERAAAKLMSDYLATHGVHQYFHKPFVWFGDRTAFEHFSTDLHFFPSGRRLAWGLPVILDVAPMVDGYAADIGYSCVFGKNELYDKMVRDLEPYRTIVLRGVRAEKTLQEIYREVDALIASQGYENRHRRYPYGVLAHRIDRIAPSLLDRLTVGGFGVPALRWLRSEGMTFQRGLTHHSPFWNGTDHCAHRAARGLWAVEPHIGHQGVGVKWEEILVVTDSDAFWLDDDLPHVRRWKTPARAPGRAAAGTA
jgi:Xaa-Pro aminopeptidase